MYKQPSVLTLGQCAGIAAVSEGLVPDKDVGVYLHFFPRLLPVLLCIDLCFPLFILQDSRVVCLNASCS